jgi:hypothetical protein
VDTISIPKVYYNFQLSLGVHPCYQILIWPYLYHLCAYYIEGDLRSISAVAVREISKNASDKFKGVASAILPTVHYGTFDSHKDIAEVWIDFE